jgi:hypothetical protein
MDLHRLSSKDGQRGTSQRVVARAGALLALTGQLAAFPLNQGATWSRT